MKTHFDVEIKQFVVIQARQQLLATVVFRKHIERENIGQAVVVEIGDVVAHRGMRRVADAGIERVGKSAVAIIDI
ncbi:hypothetical protein D3C87_1762320 [compost metagenome]